MVQSLSDGLFPKSRNPFETVEIKAWSLIETIEGPPNKNEE